SRRRHTRCLSDWSSDVCSSDLDRACGWAIDGHRNCESWLVQHCGMAYSTAKDRVRVAHELERRPLLAAALAEGTVSYGKVKVLKIGRASCRERVGICVWGV